MTAHRDAAAFAAYSNPSDMLEDEELAANWALRVDELIALEAIFEDSFRTSGTSKEGFDDEDVPAETLSSLPTPREPTPLYCCISVHVELPQPPIQICLSVPTAQPTSTTPQQDQAASTPTKPSINDSIDPTDQPVIPIGRPVSYLPPLQLNLTLPPDYPSHSMPVCELACSWLSQAQLQEALSQLQQLWEVEGQGQNFCYAWVEWLQRQLLPHLGIGKCLVLGAALLPSMHANHDAAGPSTSTRPPADQDPSTHAMQHLQQMALSVVRYAGMREQAEFEKSYWACSICFESLPGTRCVRLPDCSHYYCRDCISQHCRTKVEDGSVDNIRCPQPDCRMQVAPYVLRSLLTQEEFERWEELLLSRTLDKMEDVVYCPRCKTSSLEDADHCAQCPRCFFVFCSLCNQAWHPGENCVDPSTRLQILEKRAQGSREDAERLAVRIKQLVEEVRSREEVQRSSRACPGCGSAIQKSEGCNKMTCSYCSTKFCYKCGQRIGGYDHFGADTCELFDQETIDRWNMMEAGVWRPNEERQDQMDNGRAAVQLARNVGRPGAANPLAGQVAWAQRICNCPVCGQPNLKMHNNNAMRCWACGTSMCYRCRAQVQGKVSMHFKPKGQCPQHSDD